VDNSYVTALKNQVKKYNVTTYFSDPTSLLTYNETGPSNYSSKFTAFSKADDLAEKDAGSMLNQNLQDRDFRSALNIFGFKTKGDPEAAAVEWYQMDYEYAQTPVRLSERNTLRHSNTSRVSAPSNSR
jgi:polyamine oxidase